MREEQRAADERLREEQRAADERLREEQKAADERLREEQKAADERLREEQRAPVIPGEILYGDGDITINDGAERLELTVVNTGDRPVQVGSHVHLPQSNAALEFDRVAAHGHRLDIPAGTAVRFEPGISQDVSLVPLAGTREVYGLSLNPPGKLDT